MDVENRHRHLCPPEPVALPKRRSAEIIVGYRWWRVWFEAGQPRLVSESYATVWKPGEAMTGEVGTNLTSGVHAYATRELSDAFRENLDDPNFMAYSGSDMHVCGEVSLWGRVIRSEGGYQAERAYPRRIFIHPDRRFTFDFCAALRREYGVEVDESPEAHGKT